MYYMQMKKVLKISRGIMKAASSGSRLIKNVRKVQKTVKGVVKTAKKCISAGRSAVRGFQAGSAVGGAYGAVGGAVVGLVVNGRNTIGCVKGVIKYAKPVYKAAKKVVTTVVNVGRRAVSAVTGTARRIGSWASGLWRGKRRLLQALPSAEDTLMLPAADHQRNLLQTSSAVLDEEEIDEEFEAEAASLAKDVGILETGKYLLDALALVDDVMDTGEMKFSRQTTEALRNITTFTSMTDDDDVDAFMAFLPTNVSSMAPQLRDHADLLKTWSSKAQERMSLTMQMQMMDMEQNVFNCFASGECARTTPAQVDQLKQLLVHRMEDQAFVLLDVLAEEVRQYEYWSLDRLPYSSGFSISRYVSRSSFPSI